MLPLARYWIEQLNLQPHPEGGFFKETYRALGTVTLDDNCTRSYSTGIYFLLLENIFSAFHRIKSDEMWHFYAGDSIHIYWLDTKGQLRIETLGSNFEKNEQFQLVVPAHTWFAARMAQPNTFGLVGCTVAPGFDFQDFEMANRDMLIKKYPAHQRLITELTYPF